jgi:hypothetical protein
MMGPEESWLWAMVLLVVSFRRVLRLVLISDGVRRTLAHLVA